MAVRFEDDDDLVVVHRAHARRGPRAFIEQWFPSGLAAQLPVHRGSVELTDGGLRLVHPILAVPLVLPWEELAGVAVDDPPRWEGKDRPACALFPIARHPGIGHPLDEPTHLLEGRTGPYGVTGVALAALDLGQQLPNAVLVLRRAWDLRMAAPRSGASGWVPPAWHPYGASASERRQLLDRRWTTIHTRGLYLRVRGQHDLAAALGERGLRVGLRCDEWARLSGQPHHDLPVAS